MNLVVGAATPTKGRVDLRLWPDPAISHCDKGEPKPGAAKTYLLCVYCRRILIRVTGTCILLSVRQVTYKRDTLQWEMQWNTRGCYLRQTVSIENIYIAQFFKNFNVLNKRFSLLILLSLNRYRNKEILISNEYLTAYYNYPHWRRTLFTIQYLYYKYI